MASLIEAVEDIIRANHSFIKITLFTAPVFYSYLLYKQNAMQNFYIIAAIALIFLLTFMTTIFENIRNCTNKLLPDFNPLPFLRTMIKLVVSMGPICVVFYFLVNWLLGLHFPLQEFQYIYENIVWVISIAYLVLSYMLFAKSGNVLSAYNVPLVFKYCIDIVFAFLFFLVKLALFDAVILGFIIYVFNVFWGLNNLVFIAICSYMLVLNVAISGYYLAQLHYEIIPKEKDEKEKGILL